MTDLLEKIQSLVLPVRLAYGFVDEGASLIGKNGAAAGADVKRMARTWTVLDTQQVPVADRLLDNDGTVRIETVQNDRLAARSGHLLHDRQSKALKTVGIAIACQLHDDRADRERLAEFGDVTATMQGGEEPVYDRSVHVA